MNPNLKKTSTFLITWFLITFLPLQHTLAQYAISNHDESSSKSSNFTDFKITTWNVEWLSCPSNGPKNKELQINNVVSMIKTMNSDLIALQEIGTSYLYTTIDTLARRLGSDWEGLIVPWNASNCAQNQGIIYKKSKINVNHASLINNGGSSYDWSSGRFPVLYEVNFVVEDQKIPVSFINIHAKAYSDVTSYTRRKNAANGLKNLLDGSSYNTKRIVILGDFNDYLEGTTCYTCSGISPYKNFMDDVNHYRGITTKFKTIDNLIITNELFDFYVDNSALREFSATQTIPNYTTTTTDHIPISVLFRFTDNLKMTDFNKTASLHVFPNPTTGELRITNYELRIDNVEIYDVFGRKMGGLFPSNSLEGWTRSGRGGEEGWQPQADGVVIDITPFPAGVYFVKITTEEGIVFKKVIKN